MQILHYLLPPLRGQSSKFKTSVCPRYEQFWGVLGKEGIYLSPAASLCKRIKSSQHQSEGQRPEQRAFLVPNGLQKDSFSFNAQRNNPVQASQAWHTQTIYFSHLCCSPRNGTVASTTGLRFELASKLVLELAVSKFSVDLTVLN